MAICKLIFHFLRASVLSMLFFLLIPYVAGYLAYGCAFGGIVEQLWLDKTIDHLALLKARCPEEDDELREVLIYAMQRYHRIGPFDVAVSRCNWYPVQSNQALGINNPLVPGITLNIDVLRLPISDGAMILVHESLHDHYPYVGHGHVNPIMSRLEALNMRVRRQ